MSDEAATVGIASTTTDLMDLKIEVTPQPFEGNAKLQLLGEDDRPERGVRTTAFLPPGDLRALGEELIAAADELKDAADTCEGEADE